jgi:ribose transport system substrate-binding protein
MGRHSDRALKRREGKVQSTNQGSRPRRWQVKHTATGIVLVALISLAGVASVSAGTSSRDERQDAVTKAKQLISRAKAPLRFTAPGPSFDASKAKGKSVYYIAQALNLEFTRSVTGGIVAGLRSAGVKVTTVDDKANISETARLIQQGIALHPAAIIIAERSELLRAPIKAAKKAGIPVIAQFEYDPRLPSASERALGVVAQVTFCYSCAGRLLADYAVANSNGNVHSITYWSPDDGVGKFEIGGIRNELARLCSSCKAKFKDVLIAQWATQIPTKTQSDLRDHSINYFLPVYDGMTLFMLPAIHAANAQNRVKIVSFNADKSAMKSMARHDVIVADVGSPLKWFGFAVADETLRVITGHPAIANERVPLRLFDNSNLPNLKKDESTWYGANFQAGYKKLWKLH